MKKILAMLVVFMMSDCSNGHKPVRKKATYKVAEKKASAADTIELPMIQYTDRQLEGFLDSVGHLSTKPIADKAAFGADSVFRHQQQLDTLISLEDLKTLKKAIRRGFITVKSARRIFNNPKIDSLCTQKNIFLNYKQGLTPIEFYPFSKNKGGLDEYAICIGDPDHCPNACLYFFKGNRVIAMHNFCDRFGPGGLHHYQDSDGKTVIYYCHEFDEGSGIWWFNYFFYKYDGDKLIPVLNELQNGNEQSFWGARVLWLESNVQKTNPLTIKMVYYGQFYNHIPDSSYVYGPRLIDDSTVVKYSWDERTKTLKGQYDQSEISKAQILTYYLVDNEFLFINTYYKTIKASLLDKKKRKWTLNYLNLVKNRGLK